MKQNNSFNLKLTKKDIEQIKKLNKDYKKDFKNEEEALLFLVNENPLYIKNIKNPSIKLQWEIVKINPGLIQYLNKPSEKIQEFVMNYPGVKIYYVKNPIIKWQLKEIKNDKRYWSVFKRNEKRYNIINEVETKKNEKIIDELLIDYIKNDTFLYKRSLVMSKEEKMILLVKILEGKK